MSVQSLTQTNLSPRLPVPIAGLSQSEAESRRDRGQSNAYHAATTRSYGKILRDNALTFTNIVLASIGTLLIVTGQLQDALGTCALVIFNVCAGVVQEGRAKHTLDRTALLTRPQAAVVRDGREHIVDPSEIVLGDVLMVRPGDQIMVDGEVIGEGRINVDESLLTGESDQVEKGAGDHLLSGSFCMAGTAAYVAEKVGAESYAHRITREVRTFRRVKTRLQMDVEQIVRLLVVLASQLAILFALSAILRSTSLDESVQIAAVVMALVPQGLLAMTTVSYGMAAVRMAGKGVLIQQANAIESMSHVDVVCLDKTGTLTTNSLHLDEVRPLGTGIEELNHALRAFVGSVPDGNRTTDAIRSRFGSQTLQIRQSVPFSSERKWSGVVFADGPMRGAYILGAPEILLPSVHTRGAIGSQVAEATKQGLRVLLFARAPDSMSLHDIDGSPERPSKLTPLGLLNFRDELRPEAQETLRKFAEAGVEVKLLSGDNPETVAAFVRQAGFGPDSRLISGPELAQLDGATFSRAVAETSIFGRLTPQQKQQIIRSLGESGKYVAMVGDGVNDVLALKESSVALAMQSGSQVTRGMADIVLMENSFAALPLAFREGQRIIQGMIDVMRLLLTRTLSLGLLIVGSAIVGVRFPITPRQDGIISVLTVGIPILGLTAWARPGTPPRNIFRSIAHFVPTASFSVATLLLAIHVLYLQTTGNVVLARTALTTTAVLCGLVLIAFVEPPVTTLAAGDTVSGDWRPGILAFGMAGVYCVLLFVPFARTFFGLTELRIQDLAVILAGVAIWAVALIFLWRSRLFERWLRIDTT